MTVTLTTLSWMQMHIWTWTVSYCPPTTTLSCEWQQQRVPSTLQNRLDHRSWNPKHPYRFSTWRALWQLINVGIAPNAWNFPLHMTRWRQKIQCPFKRYHWVPTILIGGFSYEKNLKSIVVWACKCTGGSEVLGCEVHTWIRVFTRYIERNRPRIHILRLPGPSKVFNSVLEFFIQVGHSQK